MSFCLSRQTSGSRKRSRQAGSGSAIFAMCNSFLGKESRLLSGTKSACRSMPAIRDNWLCEDPRFSSKATSAHRSRAVRTCARTSDALMVATVLSALSTSICARANASAYSFAHSRSFVNQRDWSSMAVNMWRCRIRSSCSANRKSAIALAARPLSSAESEKSRLFCTLVRIRAASRQFSSCANSYTLGISLAMRPRVTACRELLSRCSHAPAPTAVPNSASTAPTSTASAGRRRAHLSMRSTRPTGLARTGLPSRKRCRSSARSCALA